MVDPPDEGGHAHLSTMVHKYGDVLKNIMLQVLAENRHQAYPLTYLDPLG